MGLLEVYCRKLVSENELKVYLCQDDGLTIAAKGLGLENVFLNMVKVTCIPAPGPAPAPGVL